MKQLINTTIYDDFLGAFYCGSMQGMNDNTPKEKQGVTITGSKNRTWMQSPLFTASERSEIVINARSTGGGGGRWLVYALIALSVFYIYAKAWGVL